MRNKLLFSLSCFAVCAVLIGVSIGMNGQSLPGIGQLALNSALAGPVLVNQITATPVNGGSTITATYAPTTGNTVIGVCALMSFANAAPTATFGDGGTNTYTQDDSYYATADLGFGGRFPGYFVFRKSNVTGGSFTYTCTLTPPGGQTYSTAMFITEWSGLTASSPLDGTPVHTTLNATAQGADSGALTTTNATDLLLGIYVLPASGASGLCAPIGGANLISASSVIAIVPSGLIARNVSTTGSRHAACSMASGIVNTSIMGQLAYKAQ